MPWHQIHSKTQVVVIRYNLNLRAGSSWGTRVRGPFPPVRISALAGSLSSSSLARVTQTVSLLAGYYNLRIGRKNKNVQPPPDKQYSYEKTRVQFISLFNRPFCRHFHWDLLYIVLLTYFFSFLSSPALQLVDYPYGNGMEVVFAGGRRELMHQNQTDPEYPDKKGDRRDGKDLIQEWLDKRPNSHYVWNKTAFDEIDVNKVDRVIGTSIKTPAVFEL